MLTSVLYENIYQIRKKEEMNSPKPAISKTPTDRSLVDEGEKKPYAFHYFTE